MKLTRLAWLSGLLSLHAWAAPELPAALSKDHLVYCSPATGFAFDAQHTEGSMSYNVVLDQVYDRLVTFNEATQRIEPTLAERVSLSEDGLTVTLFLRKNVAFHRNAHFTPTRDFNHEDVIFSLNLLIGKVPERFYLTAMLAQVANQMNLIDLQENIQQISSHAPYQVQIQLRAPDPHFLMKLANQTIVMRSAEYASQLARQQQPHRFNQQPIGTGAYQLVSHTPYEDARLDANPHYWNGKPAIAHVVVDYSADSTGRMVKFLNGECDVVAMPEPSQLLMLQRQAQHGLPYQIVRERGANVALLGFNTRSPKLQSASLRRTLAGAIDRQRLNQRLFYHTAQVATQLLPERLLKITPVPDWAQFHLPTLYTPMPEKLTLWVLDEKRVYNPHPLKMAILLQHDLAKLGVKLKIRQVNRSELAAGLRDGSADYDLILAGWLANSFDPNSMLAPLLSCRTQNQPINFVNWCSPRFDALILEAKNAETASQQAARYGEADAIVRHEMPLLPLVNVDRLLVVSPRVANAKIDLFGSVHFATMRLVTAQEPKK